MALIKYITIKFCFEEANYNWPFLFCRLEIFKFKHTVIIKKIEANDILFPVDSAAWFSVSKGGA